MLLIPFVSYISLFLINQFLTSPNLIPPIQPLMKGESIKEETSAQFFTAVYAFNSVTHRQHQMKYPELNEIGNEN